MTLSALNGSPPRLYNTATRSVVPLELDPQREVTIYTCGPTVYRPVHLGNLRSYLLADSLKRLLLASGYQVRHVKNITDVGHMRQELLDRGEDKIVAEALSAGLTPAEIARRFTDEFFRDEERIGILPASVFPRATDHVPRMIGIVDGLLATGHAYLRSGNVYFRVSSFVGYGELGGSVSREGLRQGVRAEVDPLKEDPRDFALWKAAEPGRRELVWPSPWGVGFPGWHIECSAMSTQHLGPQVDIHTGGVDNIFPHHEDERAQSESFTGLSPFARVWLHGQHLLADGLKMAKSTGNAYTLSDLLELEFEPLAFRYLCLTAHYRARLNFTFTSLRAAQTGLHRLRRHVMEWGSPASSLSTAALSCRSRFWELAGSDLALPACLALVWSLARGASSGVPDGEKAALARDFDLLLGLDLGVAPPRRPADPFRGAVSSSRAVTGLGQDKCALSVNVVVQPDDDLSAVERCVRSVLERRHGLDLEVVLVDATGSPDSHAWLVARFGDDARVRLVWIDHDPGAAGGRNLGLRSSRGTYVAMLDPSVELVGETWPRLLGLLDDRSVGAVGPFGLLTSDMRHYYEAAESPAAGRAPSEVDALQNYLMVFRRAELGRIGPLDEHFRFYRILDLDLSYAIRASVGRLLTVGDLPVVRHRHALWESLSEGDREERSRKNFGRFLKRWDHRHDLARHGDAAELAGAHAAVHG